MAKKFNISLADIAKLEKSPLYLDDKKYEEVQFRAHEELNILLFPLADEVFFPFMQIGSTVTDRIQ